MILRSILSVFLDNTGNYLFKLLLSLFSSRPALSERSFCNNGNVLFMCIIQCAGLQPHVISKYLKCDLSG